MICVIIKVNKFLDGMYFMNLETSSSYRRIIDWKKLEKNHIRKHVRREKKFDVFQNLLIIFLLLLLLLFSFFFSGVYVCVCFFSFIIIDQLIIKFHSFIHLYTHPINTQYPKQKYYSLTVQYLIDFFFVSTFMKKKCDEIYKKIYYSTNIYAIYM